MATDSRSTPEASDRLPKGFSATPPEARGALVRIRVAATDDQPFLDWLNAHRSAWNDSPKPRRTIREKMEQDALCGEHGGHFVVVRLSDGERLGDIVFKPVHYHPSARAWTVGRELVQEARGHGYGTEAMRLMVDWLFTNTDVYRIEGHNDVENVASQRSIEKIGWKREGLVRAAMMRDGRYRDLYSYSILRPEWEARRRAEVEVVTEGTAGVGAGSQAGAAAR